jgi:hypothetical protein
LRDVLYFANLMASDDQAWMPNDLPPEESETRDADRARYADLIEEAAEDIAELHIALSVSD